MRCSSGAGESRLTRAGKTYYRAMRRGVEEARCRAAARRRQSRPRRHPGRSDADFYPIDPVVGAGQVSRLRRRDREIHVAEAYSGVLTDMVLKGDAGLAWCRLSKARSVYRIGFSHVITKCWSALGENSAVISQAGLLVRSRSSKVVVARASEYSSPQYRNLLRLERRHGFAEAASSMP